ncbi:MAG: sigma-54 dependent transcriptional regulator [Nitrospiraceae bacterium]|nr:sigma-54 dependent transcriptional regulator [Nitrospiraceae bacterium]
MNKSARLLIVDDEKIALKNLEHVMKKEGYQVTSTQSGQTALNLLAEQQFDVVLTDLRMEKVDGMMILKKAKELDPSIEVIMITGYATLQSAVEATKHGAFFYIAKPFKLDEVRKVVKEAAEKVLLKRVNSELLMQIDEQHGKVRIITQNSSMLRLLETAKQIAPTDCNVILTGESGTGKELFARFIHFNSKRAGKNIVALNCGAFPEELIASELFGHEKGAFTGAAMRKTGLIEAANGSTLFLDEITEMSSSMQVKLLRAIQEKEILRLGSTEPLKVDVRFIAATNKDMHDEIGSGRFRKDLYYRLNVVTLHIPPLSERKDDIPLLCSHFIRKYSAAMMKNIRALSPEAADLLQEYDFPGNVRELENIIERAVALSTGSIIEVASLPSDIRSVGIKTFRRKKSTLPSLEEQEQEYIKWVMKESGGNKTTAARILGIDRVSLWRKLKKYGLEA